jgi:hypothetical protein
MSESRALLGLLCLSSILLAACSTEHEFRVASVGDGSAGASTEVAATSPGAPLVVAGSALLGTAARISLGAPAGQPGGTVNGTIAGILPTSGQSVVQLTDGTTLLVNGVGGAVGQTVSIDVAGARVIGGPTSLVGVNVLPLGGAGGELASATVGGSGGVTATVGTAGSASPLPRNPGGMLGAPSAVTSVAQPVTGTVTTSVNGTVGQICC